LQVFEFEFRSWVADHEKNADCKVKVNDVKVKEGNSGTTPAVFTVSLNSFAIDEVTVAYTTVDGTAIAGSDYLPVAGTLVFAPGDSVKTVTVQVIGDTVREPNETFQLTLLNPSPNAIIEDGVGVATIVNDDK
jgi:Calx-beta domain-containing protein